MKINKLKKSSPPKKAEDSDSFKLSKKVVKDSPKVNVKSKKFWQERFEDEGEDLEKFIR